MIQKLLLVSIIFASVAIPAWAARDDDARHGLRKVVLFTAIFQLIYLIALKYLP